MFFDFLIFQLETLIHFVLLVITVTGLKTPHAYFRYHANSDNADK